MPRKARDRVNGPEKHGRRWRAIVTKADGTRSHIYFDSEGEARSFVADARATLDNKTVGVAVNEYLEHLGRYGGEKKRSPLRPSTINTARYRLTAFFQLEKADLPLSDLKTPLVRRLYGARVKSVRADTHRGELTLAFAFCEWLTDKGELLSNPVADVRPEGELSTGKQTLTVDEARVFLSYAMREESVEGLACAVVLVMGLRASELTGLKAKDVDAGGTILRIASARDGKTRAATRDVKIPGELRDRLRALAATRKRDEPLFGMTRYALHYQVGRICDRTGVSRVCPHGLRGSMITLRLDGGESLHAVQADVGHEIGSRVTERHYIAPGTLESVRAREASSLLFAGNELGMRPIESYPAPTTEEDAPHN